nr:hypothetical protein [Candidatus Sigynarchaeota archaeon]
MVLLYNMLRGRIEPGTYHLFGPAATGKTTIALCCAASLASFGRCCAWIDTTKGFSPKRFAAISITTTGKDHSNRVLLNTALTPLAVEHAIERLTGGIKKWRVGLVVLDTAFGAMDQTVQDPAIRRVMWVQAKDHLARLALLAATSKVPSIIINTVGYKPGQDQERPTGEQLVRGCMPEDVVVRPIIGTEGYSGRFTYVSCDDETEYEIVAGGIKQKAIPVAPGGTFDEAEATD